MESGPTWSATTATSRRDLRTPETGRSASRQRSRRPARKAARPPAWLPRAAVVAALGGATIAVPLADLAAPAPGSAAELTAAGAYPSSFEVLSAAVQDATPTTLLAPAPTVARDAGTVSRSVTRDPLPDCDASVAPDSPNGQIPVGDLCTLWDGSNVLRGDAAVALTELDDNFRAAFDRDLCITDSYRTLAEQRRLAWTKPGLAATPGTSNHGWGLAIDLCSSETNSSAVMSWLSENGPVYGWDNPAWARRGGSGAYEPWHWEFVPGTTAMGTNWD